MPLFGVGKATNVCSRGLTWLEVPQLHGGNLQGLRGNAQRGHHVAHVASVLAERQLTGALTPLSAFGSDATLLGWNF